MKYSEALKFVWEKWPIATPNFGFEKHLIRLEISAPLIRKTIENEKPIEEEKKIDVDT